MPTLLKSLALLVVVLAVPLVPLLVWGESIHQATISWTATDPPPSVVVLVVAGLLTFDVFLPVPSSLVNTWAGAQLGTAVGGLVCFIGLSFGAALGFALGKWARPTVRERWLAEKEVVALEEAARRWGAAILVVTRALPLLAEAAVLLLGIQGLSWRRFWPPVLLSNAGIAVAYAALGTLAAEQEWLVVALAISAGLPLLVALLVRRHLLAARGTPPPARESAK